MSQNRPDLGTPPNLPPWVKIFGIVLILLVLAVVILHLSGINLGALHSIP